MLTSCQQAGLVAFESFLSSPDKEFSLTGVSGAGKTYLTIQLINTLIKFNEFRKQSLGLDPVVYEVVATTNKAAGVLSETLTNYFTAFKPVTTVHSFFRFKYFRDYKTGKEVFSRTQSSPNLFDTILFIDEASYLDDNLKSKIMLSIKTGSKVVYIGDKDQLLAVGSSTAPALELPNSTHLQTTSRQKPNSNITALAHAFRETLYGSPWPNINDYLDHEVHLLNESQLHNVAESLFTSHDYFKNPNHVKLLAWTNDSVIGYNQECRKIILDTESDEFLVGEVVVTNDPVINAKGAMVATAGTPLTIHSVVDDVSDMFSEDIPFTRYTTSSYGSTIYLSIPKNRKQVEKLSQAYAKEQNWREYFALKDTFHDARSYHAITVHKAQGSTFTNVLIDLADIGKNQKADEVARLLYVACSRPTTNLYLFGELPKKYRG